MNYVFSPRVFSGYSKLRRKDVLCQLLFLASLFLAFIRWFMTMELEQFQAYCRSFADKDGKVWQGGGGRNPPPEAPHLVQTTPEIEALRPKSPMKNQQQLQQQSSSISLTTGNSSNKRPTANSPQNHNGPNMNQEASSSNISTTAPWGSPMEGFKGREGGLMPPDDRMFDMYGYNASFGQGNADFLDYESQRAVNML